MMEELDCFVAEGADAESSCHRSPAWVGSRSFALVGSQNFVSVGSRGAIILAGNSNFWVDTQKAAEMCSPKIV